MVHEETNQEYSKGLVARIPRLVTEPNGSDTQESWYSSEGIYPYTNSPTKERLCERETEGTRYIEGEPLNEEIIIISPNPFGVEYGEPSCRKDNLRRGEDDNILLDEE